MNCAASDCAKCQELAMTTGTKVNFMCLFSVLLELYL